MRLKRRSIEFLWNKQALCALIVLLLLAVPSFAQNISVVSFQRLENDLTARTQRVDDQNGEPCALIKVVVASDGFMFEGDGLGIVKTLHKTGEYYVYVPRGAKYLTVKHEDLGVLRQYAYPEKIEKQATYELVLSNAKVKTVVEQDAGGQFLALSVTPCNATLYIDNELRSLDFNGELSEFLSYGKHTYRIEAASFVAQTGDFTIKRDAATELKVNLQSALATLSVDCSTQDAEIYINQQLKSKKSWHGELSAGMYLIEVKLSGHRNYKQSVQLAQQEVKNITIPALEPVYGSLKVNYKPIGANIILDGKNIGKSPNVFEKILVGNHTLTIEKDEYKKVERTVTIEEAKIETVSGELELRPKNGSLKVDYKPADAIVVLDDITIGKASDVFRDISIGEHKVSIEKYGYKRDVHYIIIEATKTTIVSGKLKKSETVSGKPKKEKEDFVAKPFMLALGGFYSINNDKGIQMKFGRKIYLGGRIEIGKNPERRNIMLGRNWLWQNRLSFYTGLGYGVRNYYYYPNGYLSSIGVAGGSSPIKITENSTKGLDLEAGVNLMFTRSLGVSIGCNVLQFKYSDFSAGLILKF